MAEPASDLSKPVHFSTDAWLMSKVPWALWVMLAGFAIVLNAGGRSGIGPGAGVAIVYLAALFLLFIGWAAIEKIEQLTIPFVLMVLLVMVGVIIVSIVVELVVGSVGGTGRPRYGGQWYSGLVDPPLPVFGWMLIYMGAIWTAYALYRHHDPAQPILALTPAGVAYQLFWLKNLQIPWNEILNVGVVPITNSWGKVTSHTVHIEVSRAFYEHQIASRVGVLAPPGVEGMFAPKGEDANRMILTTMELAVDGVAMHREIAARWNEYRHKITSVPQLGGQLSEPITYGRWSFDGSARQALSLIAPLVGMGIVAAHSALK